MVKSVMSSMAMAVVAASDATSLLQLSAGMRQSQGQRILAAVAEQGEDTICLEAAAGDVAPVTGSFTARMSQEAVVVAAGSVAGEAGSFCVAKQDVLLIQRTFGLNSARDFEAALGSKATTATTTTTMDWTTFDFAGNLTKEVTVKAGECPNVKAGLVQTVEASVSDKKEETAEKKLDADQLRVCGCRNFLKNTELVEKILDMLEEQRHIRLYGNFDAALQRNFESRPVLLQRNFDAALASKSTVKATTTTTTTTTSTTTIDHKLTAEFELLATACTLASTINGSWTQVAKEVNDPKHADLFKSINITGGWEHCDKSWVVQGACREFLLDAPCEYVQPARNALSGFVPARKCRVEGAVTALCCAQMQGMEGQDACLPFRQGTEALEVNCELVQ